jgi:Adenylate cyclase regulatory domain
MTADFDIEHSGLLDGLEGRARTDRAELILWLLDRGFSVEQIGAATAPLLQPAQRVMGDDGVYLSAREACAATGLDLRLLQRLQSAGCSIAPIHRSWQRCTRRFELLICPLGGPADGAGSAGLIGFGPGRRARRRRGQPVLNTPCSTTCALNPVRPVRNSHAWGSSPRPAGSRASGFGRSSRPRRCWCSAACCSAKHITDGSR